MKKSFFALLCLLFCLPAFSQGVQKQEKIAGLNAFTYYPPDFLDSQEKKYPAIIFFPGLGEAGTDAGKLLVNGPAKFLAAGWKPTGYLVFSVQPTYGWVSAAIIDKVVTDIITRYRVDTGSIHLTGLSAGGSGIETYALTPGYASKIKSLVPMSTPEIPASHQYIKPLAPLGIKWLGFSGSRDTHTTKMRTLFSLLDEANPGAARLIIREGLGHCCWNDVYDPDFKISPTEGNIYEWMIAQGKPAVPPGPPLDTSKKVIQIFHDPDKVGKIIIIDKDLKTTIYEREKITVTDLKMELIFK